MGLMSDENKCPVCNIHERCASCTNKDGVVGSCNKERWRRRNRCEVSNMSPFCKVNSELNNCLFFKEVKSGRHSSRPICMYKGFAEVQRGYSDAEGYINPHVFCLSIDAIADALNSKKE